MLEKHNLYRILLEAKETHPEKADVIEQAIDKVGALYESIGNRERKFLKTYPIQFINKIYQKDGFWTSRLHLWALEGVKEILDIDPLILSFKDSYGDTVLMSFVKGATGGLNGKTDYNLIKEVLSRDFVYSSKTETEDGKEELEEKNLFDEVDSDGQTIIEHLTDIAYSSGDYEGEDEDLALQEILNEFVGASEASTEQD